MNPNSEKIIKALECCAVWGDCKKCPYDGMPFKSKKDNCAYHSTTDALALIKEQQAEIETLRVENETLKIATNDQYAHLCDCHDKIAEMLRQKEADTVKKMQEKLKLQWWSDATPHDMDILHSVIDRVAKEILEDL